MGELRAEEFGDVAKRVCTDAEREVLELMAAGKGQRAIARELGISRSAARDRYHAAAEKIERELAGGG